jgi:uncharacterized membrane protein SirB2
MIELYAEIKWVHVYAVLASGILFMLRGFAVNVGATWAMAAPLRYLSYGIDTVLLVAAILLSSVLHLYPFVHSWLTAKVVLLAVYIVLGSIALKRGRTRRTRIAAYALALLVFSAIIMIAHAHDPWAPLRFPFASATPIQP